MDRPLTLTPDDVEYGEKPLNPHVVDVEPLPGYRLRLAFSSGEVRVFDVSSYLDRGVFRQLRDETAFREAYVEAGSVEWPGGQGLSFNTLYLDSTLEEL